MSETPKYFMYFPGNYRWSAAFVNMLGRSAYGGADISELHKIGRLLEGKHAEDDEAWFDACVRVADEVRETRRALQGRGPSGLRRGVLPARLHYYQMGERFRTPKDKQALDAYRIAVDCFHQFRRPHRRQIEIVEVPFEGVACRAIFVHAKNAKRQAHPCVVFFDGLDVTKEIQFVARRARAHQARHLGPGHGRPRAPARRSVFAAISAPRLRGRRQRLHRLPGEARRRRSEQDRRRRDQPRWLLCSALRLARAAVCGLHRMGRDLGLLRRMEAEDRRAVQPSLSVPGHHIMWIFGADTLEEAFRRLDRSDSTAWCRECGARSWSCTARTTSRFR